MIQKKLINPHVTVLAASQMQPKRAEVSDTIFHLKETYGELHSKVV